MNIFLNLRRKTTKNGHKSTNNVRKKCFNGFDKNFTTKSMVPSTNLSPIYKSLKANMIKRRIHLKVQCKSGTILTKSLKIYTDLQAKPSLKK